MTIKQQILLLTEEQDIKFPDDLYKAIENGRVPGVKPIDAKRLKKYLDYIIDKFKDFPSQYRNAAIKLATKLLAINVKISVDSMLAYFNNRNKQEAKTTYKQLFTDFENGNISDYNFEKKVNELFRDKSVGKEEANKLFEDSKWLMVIPKTFAASCKYGEGTKWCTTSQKSMFDNYSKQSPLIIIIDKTKDSKLNPLAKVQFHAKSNSILDAKDEKIDILKYVDALPEKIQEILKIQGFNKWSYVLEDAVKNGNIKQVKEAIENGADIHADNDYALRLAADKGHTEVVKFFLDKGADIHANDDNALQWASLNGHAEVVKILLKAGADVHTDNDISLRWAAQNGHAEVVTLLLDKGANIHANDDFALRWAAHRGRTEVVKILLDKGANIHANNDDALQWAAQKGHAEIVTLLLNKGANIHADDDQALRWASLNGYTEVVKILLKAGADVHAKGDYALRWATEKGHTKVVTLLKKYANKGK